jgi:hypothetical protein
MRKMNKAIRNKLMETKWASPFKLSPDGWIMYYKEGKAFGCPWCYWSVCGGFEEKDIEELYALWLDGKLQKDHPYLPTPPSIGHSVGGNLKKQ